MIYEIKNYFCNQIPTENDITEAVEESRNLNCCIRLSWYGPAHGFYGDDIHYVDINPLVTVDEIMYRVPKIYGV